MWVTSPRTNLTSTSDQIFRLNQLKTPWLTSIKQNFNLHKGDPVKIPLLNKYQRLLTWFISGLVFALLLSLGTLNQQPATAANQAANQNFAPSSNQSVIISDFAATHLEPNFYQ